LMEIIVKMNYNSKSILALCRTNKRFAQICSDEQLWKKLVQKKDPSLQKLPDNVNSWKDFYLNYLYIPDFDDTEVRKRLRNIIDEAFGNRPIKSATDRYEAVRQKYLFGKKLNKFLIQHGTPWISSTDILDFAIKSVS
jgi:hypothetical protein